MTLAVIVAASWALVALTPLAVRALGRFAGWALAAGLLSLLAAVVALRTDRGTFSEIVPWLPGIDVALRLRLNGLSFLFVILVLGVGALVLIYSSSYIRAKRSPGFYLLMSAFAAAMLLLVLADDLVVFFVAWELTTLCSYLLILRSGPEAKEPATRTLLVTVAGGLCLLGAVATTIVYTGTSDLTAALNHPVWTQNPTVTAVVAMLVALAAMTKSAQFPFHAWLPDAMVAPAPVSAYLHAAAMVKAGIFALLVFAPAASNTVLWPITLITIGLFTSLLGSYLALKQSDLKKLLAYSTVSQLGLLVAVIGVGTPLALLAATTHVLAHALFKSAGFMAVGLIERRYGTRDIAELSGMWRSTGFDSAMVLVAVASMAGLAPTLGFVSKELIIDSFLQTPGPDALGWALAALVTVGAVLTVAYSARVAIPTMPGARTQVRQWRNSAAMSLPVATVAIAGLCLGLVVPALNSTLRPAAADAAAVPMNQIYELALWHGINAPLVLSTVAVVAGVALAYLLARRARRQTQEPGVSAIQIVQNIQDGIIRHGARVGALTRFDSPAAHLAIPIVLIGSATLAAPMAWQGLGSNTSTHALDLLPSLIVLAGIVALLRSRSRLGALISIGSVGFGVVIWFFTLGASDVALTQLLVEILTVAVIVLVLRRLPRTLPKPQRRRAIPAALAAIAAGVTATVATLIFTGHRDISEAGTYFLTEAEELTGGSNIVNTILVDFRALDTFGELVVLATGAVALAALLDARSPVDRRPQPLAYQVLASPVANAVFLRSTGRVLLPIMVFASAYALLRGHNAPGGGFIAALLGAAVIVLAYLAAPTDDVPKIERHYLAIAGMGIIVAAATGLLGLLDGSFLRPIHVDVGGVHLTSALVFDLGVYLAVFGVIMAAVNRLGLNSADSGAESGSASPSSDQGARDTAAPQEADR